MYNACLHVDSVRSSDVDGIQYQVSASVQRCVVISYSICAAPPLIPPLPPPVQLTQGAQPVFTTR